MGQVPSKDFLEAIMEKFHISLLALVILKTNHDNDDGFGGQAKFSAQARNCREHGLCTKGTKGIGYPLGEAAPLMKEQLAFVTI